MVSCRTGRTYCSLNPHLLPHFHLLTRNFAFTSQQECLLFKLALSPSILCALRFINVSRSSSGSTPMTGLVATHGRFGTPCLEGSGEWGRGFHVSAPRHLPPHPEQEPLPSPSQVISKWVFFFLGERCGCSVTQPTFSGKSFLTTHFPHGSFGDSFLLPRNTRKAPVWQEEHPSLCLCSLLPNPQTSPVPHR